MNFMYQSRTSEVYGGTIFLTLLATFLVIARLVARRISAAGLWWDDFIVLVALVLDWGLSLCYWVQIELGGLGRHTLEAGGPVGLKQIFQFFKLFLASEVIYLASAAAIKSSLILLYYRIFGAVRWFRWVLATTWSIVVLYFVICVFVAVFECSPVQFLWDKDNATGHCINQNKFFRWNGVVNLLIDFVIWTLILPVIWTLGLSRQQKWSLSGVLLLGLFACVASIVRVVAFNWVNSDDVTYTVVPAAIWSSIEQSMGIICACLPTTRPLFARLLQKIKHSHDHSNDSYARQTAQGSLDPLPYSASKPVVSADGKIFDDGFPRLNKDKTGASSVTARISGVSVSHQ